MSGALDRAEAILRHSCGNRVRTAFPMAPLTTFRIGGPAALYLEVASERDLVAAGEAIRETGLPYVIVGKGSNIIVSDDGFVGLVLRLGKGYRWVARDNERLAAGGGMPLPALSGVALSHSLSGLEFGVAIPASFGGAVRMNAGAHRRELADVLDTIDVFILTEDTARSIPVAEAGFAYRTSRLPSGGVVVGATMRLSHDDPADIRHRMGEARAWRRRTQPLAEPNCGSVFRNPPGEYAARLIDEAGAKGMSVGGAAISRKHANFIVASQGARAADVVALIRLVQDLVQSRFGISLEPEVQFVGNLGLDLN